MIPSFTTFYDQLNDLLIIKTPLNDRNLDVFSFNNTADYPLPLLTTFPFLRKRFILTANSDCQNLRTAKIVDPFLNFINPSFMHTNPAITLTVDWTLNLRSWPWQLHSLLKNPSMNALSIFKMFKTSYGLLFINTNWYILKSVDIGLAPKNYEQVFPEYMLAEDFLQAHFSIFKKKKTFVSKIQ